MKQIPGKEEFEADEKLHAQQTEAATAAFLEIFSGKANLSLIYLASNAASCRIQGASALCTLPSGESCAGKCR